MLEIQTAGQIRNDFPVVLFDFYIGMSFNSFFIYICVTYATYIQWAEMGSSGHLNHISTKNNTMIVVKGSFKEKLMK